LNKLLFCAKIIMHSIDFYDVFMISSWTSGLFFLTGVEIYSPALFARWRNFFFQKNAKLLSWCEWIKEEKKFMQHKTIFQHYQHSLDHEKRAQS
jgi:hypothetical protein